MNVVSYLLYSYYIFIILVSKIPLITPLIIDYLQDAKYNKINENFLNLICNFYKWQVHQWST